MNKDLTKILETGYEFNFNDVFSKGWKLMNSKMGAFLLITLLFLVIQIVLSIIPLLNILNNFVSALFFSGYYIYCRNVTLNKEDSSDFFKGFNFAGQLILFQLVFFLLIIPFILLFFGALLPIGDLFELMSENSTPEELGYAISSQMGEFGVIGFISFIIFFCGIIYLSVSYLFTIPLIVDAKMKFWDAMELSRKVVGMKFMSFLGYGFLLYIGLILATVLTCFVGIIFIIPLLYCVIFTAYDSIFKPYEFNTMTDLDSFGEIEKDINSESQEGL